MYRAKYLLTLINKLDVMFVITYVLRLLILFAELTGTDAEPCNLRRVELIEN